MSAPRRLLALTLVVPVLALTACGDPSSSSSNSGGSTTKQDTHTTQSRPGY